MKKREVEKCNRNFFPLLDILSTDVNKSFRHFVPKKHWNVESKIEYDIMFRNSCIETFSFLGFDRIRNYFVIIQTHIGKYKVHT